MLKIYGIPRSRAFRTLWMAKELGLEYENIPIDFANNGTRAPESDDPTKVAQMLTAMPIDTRVAPHCPATTRIASAAGRSAAAIAAAGSTY